MRLLTAQASNAITDELEKSGGHGLNHFSTVGKVPQRGWKVALRRSLFILALALALADVARYVGAGLTASFEAGHYIITLQVALNIIEEAYV